MHVPFRSYHIPLVILERCNGPLHFFWKNIFLGIAFQSHWNNKKRKFVAFFIHDIWSFVLIFFTCNTHLQPRSAYPPPTPQLLHFHVSILTFFCRAYDFITFVILLGQIEAFNISFNLFFLTFLQTGARDGSEYIRLNGIRLFDYSTRLLLGVLV